MNPFKKILNLLVDIDAKVTQSGRDLAEFESNLQSIDRRLIALENGVDKLHDDLEALTTPARYVA